MFKKNNYNNHIVGYIKYLSLVVIIILIFISYNFINNQKDVELANELIDELNIPTDSLGLTLPQNDRHYLWKTEHAGNTLVEYGLKPFVNDIMMGNIEAIK
ncbi:MAG: hypothetical protein CMG75_08355, partial [Candidatus Marinimicrobia bacterium]|nr:hypothetical protein [Candidatus Neomarinimicrobiota bacterium]